MPLKPRGDSLSLHFFFTHSVEPVDPSRHADADIYNHNKKGENLNNRRAIESVSLRRQNVMSLSRRWRLTLCRGWDLQCAQQQWTDGWHWWLVWGLSIVTRFILESLYKAVWDCRVANQWQFGRLWDKTAYLPLRDAVWNLKKTKCVFKGMQFKLVSCTRPHVGFGWYPTLAGFGRSTVIYFARW